MWPWGSGGVSGFRPRIHLLSLQLTLCIAACPLSTGSQGPAQLPQAPLSKGPHPQPTAKQLCQAAHNPYPQKVPQNTDLQGEPLQQSRQEHLLSESQRCMDPKLSTHGTLRLGALMDFPQMVSQVWVYLRAAFVLSLPRKAVTRGHVGKEGGGPQYLSSGLGCPHPSSSALHNSHHRPWPCGP